MRGFAGWLKAQGIQEHTLTPTDRAAWRTAYDKLRSPTRADQDNDVQVRFCDLATQCYVAGRLAARAMLMPAYGILLHHAVERFLKARLVGVVSLRDLKDPKKYGHDLKKLWSRFKQEEPDPVLTRFDATISGLDEFDEHRYPDTIPHAVFTLSIAWRPAHVMKQYSGRKPPHHYGVPIDDVDRLIITIVDRIRMNPKAFTGDARLPRSGRGALRYQNPCARRWLSADR